MTDGKTAFMRVARSKSDFTVRQIYTLMDCMDGPRTLRALAEAADSPKPSMSRGIDKLTDLGYLVRKEDPADGRSILVSLSPVGRKFVKDILAD